MNKFAEGDRVSITPYQDRWMKGDRYATIIEVDSIGNCKLLFERSGDIVFWVPPTTVLMTLVRKALPNDR